MRVVRCDKGFTIIEAIVYIALFMIVIGGGVVSAYQIFEGSAQVKAMNTLEAEANFLQRKFDWALNGASVTTPSSGNKGSTLEVQNGGSTYTFALDGTGVVTLDGEPLSSGRVTVSNLFFDHVAAGAQPEALSYSFSVDGRFIGTTTRYLR